MSGLPRVVQVSLSPARNDSRVLRTRAALADAGYASVLLAPGEGLAETPFDARRKLMLAALYGGLGRLGSRGALAAYWSVGAHRAAYAALLASRPDAVHAHDWDTLPIAARAARRLGVPFVYDAHEVATDMHPDRFLWRLVFPHVIGAIERTLVPRASAWATVSPGIAALMTARHGLDPVRIAVVRNVPDRAPIGPPVRREGLLLHYHGILADGRGIEPALDALALLPPTTHLRLTGPWSRSGYEGAIRGRIAALGLGKRVTIAPAVPVTALLAHAAQAEIGLCLLPLDRLQNIHALPNKVFEYAAAGLCGIVSPGPDMAGFVEGNGVGVTTAYDGASLAQAITELSPDRLAAIRAKARALDLFWDTERNVLLDLYKRSVFTSAR